MALAAPSRLQVTTSPLQHHLPTQVINSGLLPVTPTGHHDDATDLQNGDKGKAKQFQGLDDDDVDDWFNWGSDREMWKAWGLIRAGSDSEEDSRFEALFEDEDNEKVVAVEEDDEIGETEPIDAITQLSRAMEQMAQEAELIASDPAPAAADTQKQTESQGRGFTSAFRNIWSKSKSHSFSRGHDCIICQERIQDKEVRVPCGHYYDKECIVSLFQASTKDESLFPPRCCKKSIPLDSVRKYLGPSLLKGFMEKSREFSTLNRVYCASPRCSQFLGPCVKRMAWLALGQEVYKCSCGTSTCSMCKKAHEAGVKHSCRDVTDKEMEDVLALGREEGWARCPGCRTMVELNMGCYHMTCLCKAEFCYLCQGRWKTCSCTQWDETRLVAAAEERIDVQLELIEAAHRPAPVLARWNPNNRNVMAPPRPRAIRPNRHDLIQAAVDDLRENHDCQHTTWRYRDGGGRCVGCYDVLDRYVFHCMDCHTVACNRCRLNRF